MLERAEVGSANSTGRSSKRSVGRTDDQRQGLDGPQNGYLALMIAATWTAITAPKTANSRRSYGTSDCSCSPSCRDLEVHPNSRPATPDPFRHAQRLLGDTPPRRREIGTNCSYPRSFPGSPVGRQAGRAEHGDRRGRDPPTITIGIAPGQPARSKTTAPRKPTRLDPA